MTVKKKYFGTDGIRGHVGDALINPEFVLKLGWAAGIVLGNNHGGKVLIGKDTRISGYMLESALEAGLSAAGMDIHLLGPMPTPGIAYLTRTFRAEAGIVISASHNLYEDNGIKFFSTKGFKIPDKTELAIEEQIQRPLTTVESAKLGKAVRVVDAAGRYVEFCKSTFPHHLNLSGLKIVVDCAQGATYQVAPNVFRELGAEVIRIGVHPDGFNINANCGSTKLELLQKTVEEEQADLGIGFDGDGDRVLMVDHLGEIVDGDELLFIMVKNNLQHKKLQGGIVGTVMSNLGFENALKNLNVPFKRTQVGDRYVLEELLKMNWTLGGENSGHIVNLNLTTTGDGIISALQVLAALCDQNKTLHEFKMGMQKFPQILINVPISKKIDLGKESKVQSAIQTAEKELTNHGRVLLRASGTEPVIRVMVEGEDKVQVEKIAQQLAGVVKQI
jgi:phosphoglucosamine mutase